MRILFLGSPTFASIPLEALVHAGYTVVGVITQPDKPAGRKRTLTAPPVKIAAERLGLPVLQPATLRDPAVLSTLTDLRPDVGIVAAYGEILRKAVLAIPALGYLNIHPSLLPRHRGPMPVAGAILAGDAETGVTVMRLTPGMDAGPILAQDRVALPATARTGEWNERLFELGTRLLLEALPRYASGQLELHEQDHSQATYTQLLQKADGQINWSLAAYMLERMVRAYDPWPGTFTTWRGQPLKLLRAVIHPATNNQVLPGTLIGMAEGPLVVTGDGLLELLELQPAGKRAMSGRAWLSGHHQTLIGEQLGG